MCEYCDGRYHPFEKPVIEDMHPVNLFENPPVNYGRYGEYPRCLRPVNMKHHKTEPTWICPFCGADIFNREKEGVKRIITKCRYNNQPVPGSLYKDIEMFNLVDYVCGRKLEKEK